MPANEQELAGKLHGKELPDRVAAARPKASPGDKSKKRSKSPRRKSDGESEPGSGHKSSKGRSRSTQRSAKKDQEPRADHKSPASASAKDAGRQKEIAALPSPSRQRVIMPPMRALENLRRSATPPSRPHRDQRADDGDESTQESPKNRKRERQLPERESKSPSKAARRSDSPGKAPHIVPGTRDRRRPEVQREISQDDIANFIEDEASMTSTEDRLNLLYRFFDSLLNFGSMHRDGIEFIFFRLKQNRIRSITAFCALESRDLKEILGPDLSDKELQENAWINLGPGHPKTISDNVVCLHKAAIACDANRDHKRDHQRSRGRKKRRSRSSTRSRSRTRGRDRETMQIMAEAISSLAHVQTRSLKTMAKDRRKKDPDRDPNEPDSDIDTEGFCWKKWKSDTVIAKGALNAIGSDFLDKPHHVGKLLYQKNHRSKEQRESPFLSHDHWSHWDPPYLTKELSDSQRAEVAKNRKLPVSMVNKFLGNIITWGLVHVALDQLNVIQLFQYHCNLIRIIDCYGIKTAEQYHNRVISNIKMKIDTGSQFSIGAKLAALDENVLMDMRVRSVEITDQRDPYLSAAEKAMANGGRKGNGKGKGKAKNGKGKGKGKGKNQRDRANDHSAPSKDRTYICFKHDPRDGKTCEDSQCKKDPRKIHLDTTKPDLAARWDKAKAMFDRRPRKQS